MNFSRARICCIHGLLFASTLRLGAFENMNQDNLDENVSTKAHPKAGHPSSSSTPFVAADHSHDGKRHLLLAASGSVATIKIPNIVGALSSHENLSIRLLFTKSAEHFLVGQSAEQPILESLRNVENVDGIYIDEDEWEKPWTRGGGILHIELRRWADLLVVAPLSANTMAKMTSGLADNLLLSVIRAWDTTGEIEGSRRPKRIIVAPAMNTAMWRHPITKKQLRVLEEDWGVDGEIFREGRLEWVGDLERSLPKPESNGVR